VRPKDGVPHEKTNRVPCVGCFRGFGGVSGACPAARAGGDGDNRLRGEGPRGDGHPADESPTEFGGDGDQAGEFDVNEYFKVLTHISMQDGYSLDYVYQLDGLGAYPILYALPNGQAPYASLAEVPENTKLADFHEHLDVEDVEQGYFEAVVMQIMARQFYLSWHANYNDAEIVCNQGAADAIVEGLNAGDFGLEMDANQKAQVRAMTNIEPAVTLTQDSAIVEVVIFTKWGGFFRQTYTISRSFPHTIEMNEENLVPYDCGIMF
jgi:hypothetical protein